jgi:hypothetical protein
MSSIHFGCKYCRKTSQVSVQRVMQAHVIRCDSCFAVNAFSDSQRMTMIQGGSLGQDGGANARASAIARFR